MHVFTISFTLKVFTEANVDFLDVNDILYIPIWRVFLYYKIDIAIFLLIMAHCSLIPNDLVLRLSGDTVTSVIVRTLI